MLGDALNVGIAGLWVDVGAVFGHGDDVVQDNAGLGVEDTPEDAGEVVGERGEEKEEGDPLVVAHLHLSRMKQISVANSRLRSTF